MFAGIFSQAAACFWFARVVLAVIRGDKLKRHLGWQINIAAWLVGLGIALTFFIVGKDIGNDRGIVCFLEPNQWTDDYGRPIYIGLFAALSLTMSYFHIRARQHIFSRTTLLSHNGTAAAPPFAAPESSRWSESHNINVSAPSSARHSDFRKGSDGSVPVISTASSSATGSSAAATSPPPPLPPPTACFIDVKKKALSLNTNARRLIFSCFVVSYGKLSLCIHMSLPLAWSTA